jgi:hypothetical protein
LLPYKAWCWAQRRVKDAIDLASMPTGGGVCNGGGGSSAATLKKSKHRATRDAITLADADELDLLNGGGPPAPTANDFNNNSVLVLASQQVLVFSAIGSCLLCYWLDLPYCLASDELTVLIKHVNLLCCTWHNGATI